VIISLKCPHCKGHIGPLLGGLRQSYCGRQRLCLKCGTIWRMHKALYGAMVGTAVVGAIAGVAVLFWLFKPEQADWFSLAWLLGWVALFWPVMYYIVWRVWVGLKK
jgi:hypothetical protein